MYSFFAKYVQKAHSDSTIKSELRQKKGLSFVDIITPSNIAFVISVIKNSRDVWDQKIRLTRFGAALPPGEREVNLRPLFTEGTGGKRSRLRLCGVIME